MRFWNSPYGPLKGRPIPFPSDYVLRQATRSFRFSSLSVEFLTMLTSVPLSFSALPLPRPHEVLLRPSGQFCFSQVERSFSLLVTPFDRTVAECPSVCVESAQVECPLFAEDVHLV